MFEENKITKLIVNFKNTIDKEQFQKINFIFKNYTILEKDNSIELEIIPSFDEIKEQNLFFLLNFEIITFKILFEYSVKINYLQNLVSLNENNTLFELKNVSKKNILAIYSIIYEDIVTCGCLKSKKEKVKVIEKINNKDSILLDTDLASGLERDQFLVYSDLAGTLCMSPKLTKIYLGLISLIKTQICYDFQEIFIPKLVSINDWFKSGHFKRFGSELMYISEFKNRENVLSISDRYQALINKELPESFSNLLKIPEKGLVFAQCESFWNFLKRKVINKEALPLKFFDVSGNSYRNEGGAVHSLTRLNEFKRLELIFVGRADELQVLHNSLHERWRKLLNILGFSYEIREVESWLGLFDENINTTDFEIIFNDSKSLEVGNLSLNSTKFISKWEVKSNGGKLYSGCSGFGLDRLVWSLFKIYGLNLEKWPENICTSLNIINWENNRIFL